MPTFTVVPPNATLERRAQFQTYSQIAVRPPACSAPQSEPHVVPSRTVPRPSCVTSLSWPDAAVIRSEAIAVTRNGDRYAAFACRWGGFPSPLRPADELRFLADGVLPL
jgi:hypothetical protein